MTKDSRQYEARMFGVHQCVMMFLLFCAVTMSAQTPCTVVMPITVVDSGGSIVKDLPPESLTTQMKGISLQSGLVPDNSKRRILIVLDGAANQERTSLKAEKWVARTLINNARPGDTFALISGNAAPIRLRFGTNNSQVLKAIDQLPGIRWGKKLGILDAVHEGLAWFGSPEFGDSVLLIHGFATSSVKVHRSDPLVLRGESCTAPYNCIETDSTIDNGVSWTEEEFPAVIKNKIGPKALQSTLIAHGVRVYVAHLGRFEPEQDELGFNTGGFTYLNSEFALRGFKFNDASRNLLSDDASKIYSAITSTYRVSVRNSHPDAVAVNFNLSSEVTRELPDLSALYPRAIPGCPSNR